jgi:hypothetical protein
MNIEHYIGFYPSRPFWAGSSINLRDPATNGKFTGLMSEEILFHSEGSCKIKIFRDGMILLRIEELEVNEQERGNEPIKQIVKRWGHYLDYLNCFYLIVDSTTCQLQNLSYFNFNEITRRDGFRVTYENGKWNGESIAFESIASVYQMSRYLSSYRPDIPIHLDSRLSMRQVINIEVFKESIRLFNLIINDKITIKLLSNVAKSLSEYKIGNYDTSLILSWFVIESVLTQKWITYLNSKNTTYPSGNKRINSDRLKNLTGFDFTINIINNLLELNENINFELFDDIDKIRGYRNKIVHQNLFFETEPEHCQLAINKATELVLEKFDFSITPNLSYSTAGL